MILILFDPLFRMDDNYCVKVADFGLSRDVYEKEYYSSRDKTTKLPVKWMAPESLDFGMYSSKSDVVGYHLILTFLHLCRPCICKTVINSSLEIIDMYLFC